MLKRRQYDQKRWPYGPLEVQLNMNSDPERVSGKEDGSRPDAWDSGAVSGSRKARREKGMQKSVGFLNILLVVAVGFAVLIVAIFLAVPRMRPQIMLVQEAGPIFSEETGLYEFWIEAAVTGYPTPTVRFGRSDSHGEQYPVKTLIVLGAGQEYTLTALARNRFGGSVAQLTLSVPKQRDTESQDDPPDITNPDAGKVLLSEIELQEELIFAGDVVECRVKATGQDATEYPIVWQITGQDGAMTEMAGNPIAWEAPLLWGTYTLRATAVDTVGREASKEKIVTVHPVLELSVLPEWSGTIFENRSMVNGDYIFAGDDALNRMARGFISFYTDVFIPFDFTVHEVELTLSDPIVRGRPSVFHRTGLGLWIAQAHWGPRPITIEDWDISAAAITSFTHYDERIVSKRWTNSEMLAKQVEEDLKKGIGEVQFRLQFAREGSNGDNRMDGVEYDLSKVSLKIKMVLNIGQ
jgi:hypothetical protein